MGKKRRVHKIEAKATKPVRGVLTVIWPQGHQMRHHMRNNADDLYCGAALCCDKYNDVLSPLFCSTFSLSSLRVIIATFTVPASLDRKLTRIAAVTGQH